jgi:hypothetical protein
LGVAGSSLAGWFGAGEELAEAVQAAFPGGAAVIEPLAGGGEAGGFEAAGADASFLFGADELGVLEDLEVLDDGGEGEVKGFGEARDRHGAVTEALQEGAAGGVTEGVEDTADVGWWWGVGGGAARRH